MLASRVEEKIMRWIAAFSLAIAPAPLFAETIYKYVDERGAVFYSSDRIPGARHEKRLTIDPSVNVVQPPRPVERDDSQRLGEFEAQREWRERAREEVLLAQAELEAAEAALIAGQTALPGERKGTCVPRANAASNASGIACMTLAGTGGANAGSVPGAPGSVGIPGIGAKFNGVLLSREEEDYDDRIAKLEAAVEKARARLENAIVKEKGY